MEEERKGRWEGFGLDMEAQEADREMHLKKEMSDIVRESLIRFHPCVLTGPLQGKNTPGQETDRTSTYEQDSNFRNWTGSS